MTSGIATDVEVRSLLDALIPGDGDRWPRASAAVDLALLDALLAGRRTFLDRHARSVLGLTEEQRRDYLRRLEIDAPDCFGRLLAAVYGAYYGSRAVQPALRSLSKVGPSEESPHVDPSLVARVRGASRRLIPPRV